MVLHAGVIQQVGEARTIYDEPANLFVAGFIGSPAMNLVEAVVDGDQRRVRRLSASAFAPISGRVGEGTMILGLRPEIFEDLAHADPGLPTIDVVVSVVEELGAEVNIFFHVDAPRVGGRGGTGCG